MPHNLNQRVCDPASKLGQIYDVDSSFSFFERTDLGLAFMLSVSISFTFEIESDPVEVSQAESQLQFTLVEKLSTGRPQVDTIRAHINSSWGFSSPATVGLLDPRYVMIHLANESDYVIAWARESNKIDNSLFRLFKWTPDSALVFFGGVQLKRR